jgi:hypothetical protein
MAGSTYFAVLPEAAIQGLAHNRTPSITKDSDMDIRKKQKIKIVSVQNVGGK